MNTFPCRFCHVNIQGPRYRCSVCVDFDLCGECIDLLERGQRTPGASAGASHPVDHLFFRVPVFFVSNPHAGPRVCPPSSLSHPVPCSLCEGIIRGHRLLCAQCGVSLCSQCDQKVGHNASHAVLRLPPPRAPLSLLQNNSSPAPGSRPQLQEQGIRPQSTSQHRPELQVTWEKVTEPPPPPTAANIISGVNSLGSTLCRSLTGVALNTSFFLSPLALSTALLLLAEAAPPSPRSQVLNALSIASLPDSVGTKTVLSPLLRCKLLRVNTALWSSRHPFSPVMRSVCMDKYLSSAYQCSSSQTVNSWGRSCSGGTISLLLDDKRPLPLLAVVTTVSLVANWLHPFCPSRTVRATFQRTPMMASPCLMMTTEGTFRYMSSPIFQAIVLPFKPRRSRHGHRADLQLLAVILLPKPGLSLHSTTLPAWPTLFQQATFAPPCRGQISLPKFSCESRFPDLTPEIKGLGVTGVFDGGEGECSGFVEVDKQGEGGAEGCGGERVDTVVHAVFISCSEKGSHPIAPTPHQPPSHSNAHPNPAPPETPAAATPHSPSFEMACCRPFQLHICDASGLRVFMGEVRHPMIGATTVQSRASVSSKTRTKSTKTCAKADDVACDRTHTTVLVESVPGAVNTGHGEAEPAAKRPRGVNDWASNTAADVMKQPNSTQNHNGMRNYGRNGNSTGQQQQPSQPPGGPDGAPPSANSYGSSPQNFQNPSSIIANVSDNSSEGGGYTGNYRDGGGRVLSLRFTGTGVPVLHALPEHQHQHQHQHQQRQSTQGMSQNRAPAEFPSSMVEEK